MPYAIRGNQTLRATARDFAYYFLRDLRDPVAEFLDFAVVRFRPIRATSAVMRQAARLPAGVGIPMREIMC